MFSESNVMSVRILLLLFTLMPSLAWSQNFNSLQDGEIARAEDLNENFTIANSRLTALENLVARLRVVEDFQQDPKTGPLDGTVIDTIEGAEYVLVRHTARSFGNHALLALTLPSLKQMYSPYHFTPFELQSDRGYYDTVDPLYQNVISGLPARVEAIYRQYAPVLYSPSMEFFAALDAITVTASSADNISVTVTYIGEICSPTCHTNPSITLTAETSPNTLSNIPDGLDPLACGTEWVSAASDFEGWVSPDPECTEDISATILSTIRSAINEFFSRVYWQTREEIALTVTLRADDDTLISYFPEHGRVTTQCDYILGNCPFFSGNTPNYDLTNLVPDDLWTPVERQAILNSLLGLLDYVKVETIQE